MGQTSKITGDGPADRRGDILIIFTQLAGCGGRQLHFDVDFEIKFAIISDEWAIGCVLNLHYILVDRSSRLC